MCQILKYTLFYGGIFSNVAFLHKNGKVKDMNGYIARNIDDMLLKWKNGNLELLEQKRYSFSTIKAYKIYFSDFMEYQ